MQFQVWPKSRRGWIRLGLLVGVPVGLGWIGGCYMIGMPGRSFRGPLPALDAETRTVAGALRSHVVTLAEQIGERNLRHLKLLRRAEAHITGAFTAAGYTPALQEFDVADTPVRNIEVAVAGASTPAEIVVIGAHYDSALGAAANDNASGTAAMLELARWAKGRRFDRTVRFVAFVNEEPPYFQQPGAMGSEVYAARCKQRQEQVVGMLSLETIGYYSDAPGSQQYPWPFSWFYPSTGNFVGFVGNVGSRRLVRRSIAAFRANTQFPSEGAAIPGFITGVDWSDHWSFWRHGYPAAMVTDTAVFRYPHYHTRRDTPDKIDFERTARVVVGLRHVVDALAGGAGGE